MYVFGKPRLLAPSLLRGNLEAGGALFQEEITNYRLHRDLDAIILISLIAPPVF